MKKLVIFYSLEGNTKFIAGKMAEELDADMLELKPETEIPKIEPLKHFVGGKQVAMRETPRLRKYDINLADYDTLIIGTPVWSFNFSPPIRTFLKENKIENKKVIIFCTHEGFLGKALVYLRKELLNNEIIAEIDFQSVLENPEENLKKLRDFIKTIKGKI